MFLQRKKDANLQNELMKQQTLRNSKDNIRFANRKCQYQNSIVPKITNNSQMIDCFIKLNRIE